MTVTYDRYRETLENLRDAVVDHWRQNGEVRGMPRLIERWVHAADELVAEHDATERADTDRVGKLVVCVIPMPVSVTPFAKLCEQLDKIKPGTVIRVVQPHRHDEPETITLGPGDMIADLRDDS